jgi:hypothetical protein
MPVVGQTKVIMESLIETWKNLKPYFNGPKNLI